MDIFEKFSRYMATSQIRATRRKSPANLLLVLLHWPLLGWLWFLQVKYFYLYAKGVDCGLLKCLPQGWPTIVYTIAPFFPAIGLSMLLTNGLLWLIPPVRRIFDAEAKPFPETSFKNAQKQLAIFSAVALVISWPAMYFALKAM